MKNVFLVLLFSYFAFASMSFEKNQKCSSCHPMIYQEYQASQHANSTVFKDPIHSAVYDKHPQKNKLQKYRCAKCHTPAADNIEELLQVNNGVIPDVKNDTQNEAVACAFCHRIVDIQGGAAMNKNIVSKEERKYFANLKSHHNSAFHDIETNVAVFENGKLCMGCHMHKTNKQKFEVCSTEHNNMDGKNNCITCHMPKVAGSVSNVHKTKEHAFHGFPGIHGDMQKYLAKYVDLKIKKNVNGFSVTISHNVTHSSTLHPLRMSQLKVEIVREGKSIHLKPINFFKTIGKDGKVSPPWLATEIVNDSRLKAGETKSFNFDFKLAKGDEISAQFGHYLIKPKALKKFGLEHHEESKRFRVIAQMRLKVE